MDHCSVVSMNMHVVCMSYINMYDLSDNVYLYACVVFVREHVYAWCICCCVIEVESD